MADWYFYVILHLVSINNSGKMKKFFGVFVLAAFVVCGGARAQFVGEGNGSSDQVDSLMLVVDTISIQVQDIDVTDLNQ